MPLLIVQLEDGEQVYEMPEGKPVVVGRSHDCDITIPSPMVSRRHAAFIFKNGLCGVKDLNSFNGTLVNDRKISAPQALVNGDVIKIYSFLIRFVNPIRLDASEPPPEPTPGKPPAEPACLPGEKGMDAEKAAIRPSRAMMSSSPALDSMMNQITMKPIPGKAARPGSDTLAAAAPDARPAEPEQGMDAAAPAPDNREAPAVTDSGGDVYGDGTAVSGEDGAEGGEYDAEDAATIQGEFTIGRSGGSMPVHPELARAIEQRLSLYGQLADLADERKLMRMREGGLPAEVAEELSRQDAELEAIPTSAEAGERADDLRERREEYQFAARRAGEYGSETPSPPPPELAKADELAMSQWRAIRRSNQSDLPPVLDQAYAVMEDEPLTAELAAAGIEHSALMGAAAYYLALKTLKDEARIARERLTARARELAEGTDEEKRGGLLGKIAGNLINRSQKREELQRLEEEEKPIAGRMADLNREMNFLEKFLLQEFWRVYPQAAVRFVPGQDKREMPLSVRAFLRFGVIGFKPWWLTEEAAEFIRRDCGDVVRQLAVGADGTNVVYADEYLEAVMNNECPPAPEPDPDAQDRQSLEFKADRALRRVINARCYMASMRELLVNLERRTRGMDADIAELDEKIRKAEVRPFFSKEELYNLQKEHQVLVTRQENWGKSIGRLAAELDGPIQSGLAENEKRFRTREFTIPDPPALLSRECRILRECCRRISGGRERFMPLNLRDGFNPDSDAVNHRHAVRQAVEEVEMTDPGIFLKTLVPSKRRAGRIDLRLAPAAVILPAPGVEGLCLAPREDYYGGCLLLPLNISRQRARRKLIINLAADYRWESAKKQAHNDVMASDTLAGAFMKLRWEWRGHSRERRERGMLFNELGDNINWRRVYELYFDDALEGGRRLFARNPELYERLIGKYIDLPDGAPLLSAK